MNTGRIKNNTLEESYIDIKDNNFPSTNGIFAHVQEQDVSLHYEMKGYHLLSSMRTRLTWWNQTCAAEIFKIKFLRHNCTFSSIALSPLKKKKNPEKTLCRKKNQSLLPKDRNKDRRDISSPLFLWIWKGVQFSSIC